MSEKNTANTKYGSGVLETIVELAIEDVEGFYSLYYPVLRSAKDIFKRGKRSSGIEISFTEQGTAVVLLHVELVYGSMLTDVARELQRVVSEALHVQANIVVDSVDVYVDAIRVQKK